MIERLNNSIYFTSVDGKERKKSRKFDFENETKKLNSIELSKVLCIILGAYYAILKFGKLILLKMINKIN
jgi:hypothetical protein